MSAYKARSHNSGATVRSFQPGVKKHLKTVGIVEKHVENMHIRGSSKQEPIDAYGLENRNRGVEYSLNKKGRWRLMDEIKDDMYDDDEFQGTAVTVTKKAAGGRKNLNGVELLYKNADGTERHEYDSGWASGGFFDGNNLAKQIKEGKRYSGQTSKKRVKQVVVEDRDDEEPTPAVAYTFYTTSATEKFVTSQKCYSAQHDDWHISRHNHAGRQQKKHDTVTGAWEDVDSWSDSGSEESIADVLDTEGAAALGNVPEIMSAQERRDLRLAMKMSQREAAEASRRAEEERDEGRPQKGRLVYIEIPRDEIAKRAQQVRGHENVYEPLPVTLTVPNMESDVAAELGVITLPFYPTTYFLPLSTGDRQRALCGELVDAQTYLVMQENPGRQGSYQAYLMGDIKARSLAIKTLTPEDTYSLEDVVEGAKKQFQLMPEGTIPKVEILSGRRGLQNVTSNPFPLMYAALDISLQSYDLDCAETLASKFTVKSHSRIEDGSWEEVYVKPDFCDICCNTIDETRQAICLKDCMHWFCEECWKQHIVFTVYSGVSKLTCPSTKCKQILPPEALIALVDAATYKQYVRQRVRSGVDGRYMAFCTGKECEQIVRVVGKTADLPENLPLTCANNHSFCKGCLRDPHWPLPCDSVPAYHILLKKNGDFTEVGGKDVFVDTKPCPNCRYKIEKSGGCPHMVCGRCLTAFCWNCLKRDSNYGHGCVKESKWVKTEQHRLVARVTNSRDYTFAMENRERRIMTYIAMEKKQRTVQKRLRFTDVTMINKLLAEFAPSHQPMEHIDLTTGGAVLLIANQRRKLNVAFKEIYSYCEHMSALCYFAPTIPQIRALASRARRIHELIQMANGNDLMPLNGEDYVRDQVKIVRIFKEAVGTTQRVLKSAAHFEQIC